MQISEFDIVTCWIFFTVRKTVNKFSINNLAENLDNNNKSIMGIFTNVRVLCLVSIQRIYPIERCQVVFMYKNYLPSHMTHVLYIGPKILSLIGQQILYADF